MRAILLLLMALIMPHAQPTPRLIVLGDSIGVGIGASDPAHSYAALISDALGMPLDNRAVSGATVGTQVIPDDLHSGDIVIWLAGYNDMRAGHDPQSWAAAMNVAVTSMRRQGARVMIGACLRMTPEGYARGAPDWNHGSDALVAAYHAALPSAIPIAYDPQHVATDLTHPNDAGHAQIAASFLAAMSTAPPIARWDGTHAATIEWTQVARGCVWRLPSTFVGCYDGDRRVRVEIGQHAPVSGDLRPVAGTVYRVVIDGTPYDVPLKSVVYLAVFR